MEGKIIGAGFHKKGSSALREALCVLIIPCRRNRSRMPTGQVMLPGNISWMKFNQVFP
jgi:hypothetical protein